MSSQDSDPLLVENADDSSGDDLCAICLDGSVYDDNDIVFCETCNVPVHQFCYGIETVPEGEWHCNVCRAGLDPNTLPCALCPFRGGAYKPTTDGRWVHVMCAIWVPEVFMEHAIKMEPANVAGIDVRREKLRCTICSEKSGQKIQCSKGQCRTACHPWCANHTPKGWLKHIRRDDHTETAEFQVYCPKHRNAVKERPADIAARAKQNPRPSARNKKRRHPGKDNNSRQDSRPSQHNHRRSSSVAARRAIADAFLETDQESLDDDDNDAVSVAPAAQPTSNAYNVCTFSEWPGQQEGEGMDLEHYWNVIAMQFPEDHGDTWLSEITGPLLKLDSDDNGNEQQLLKAPPLGCYARDSFRIAKAEETIRENFKDGTILEATNRDKHLRWLHSVVERMRRIRGFDRTAPTSPSFWEEQEIEQQHLQQAQQAPVAAANNNYKGKGKKLMRRASSEMESAASNGNAGDDAFMGDEMPLPKLPEFDLAAHSTLPPELDPYTINHPPREGEPIVERDTTLRVAIGGQLRVRIDFEVKEKQPPKLNPLVTDEIVVLGNDLMCAPPMTVDDSANVQEEPMVDLVINQLARIDPNWPVTLPDQQIIPESEDDEVCRALYSTTKAYLALRAACQEEMDYLLDSAIRSRITNQEARRTEWAAVEDKYKKMSSWKLVAECLERGIRDQLPDFNRKSDEEEIPASWHIPVPGRPKPQEDEPEEEDEHEDAVCMVCFDGTSTDQNSIVFCDGCNMAVHQACYGIHEVPDGDYFCDRCKALRELEDEYEFVSEEDASSISCCLCPKLHGGIKPTTDGKWVHLCCAVWSGSLIEDVTEMAPVNITVSVHPPIVARPPLPAPASHPAEGDSTCASTITITTTTTTGSSGAEGAEGQAFADAGTSVALASKPIPPKCYVCHSEAGFLAQCCGASCGVHFHPLCAWFDGLLFQTEITDRSYQALPSGGVYPAGVAFKVFCAAHTPADAQSRSQQAQLVLRARYQLNENSMMLAMQRRQKRHKTKRKKERDEAASQRRGTAAVQLKELKPDTYQHEKCAVCMEPSVPILDRFARPAEEERVLTCQQCRLRVHATCYAFDPEHVWANRDFWRCDACLRGEQTPLCVLCPRRGGAFKPTVDGRWVHAYCAVYSPGSYRFGPDGSVEIRSIPKESSKQKCIFCSRKTGVCARCTSGSCVHYFHALCGHMSGKAFLRLRRNGRQQYCPSHIPQHITRLPTGHWLDLKEIQQLRVQFDNARTCLDLVNRREKIKKQLYAAEADAFVAQYKSMVTRLEQGLPPEAPPEEPVSPVGTEGEVPILPKAGKRKVAKAKSERESTRLAKKEEEEVMEEQKPRLICQLAGVRLERPKTEFPAFHRRFMEKYNYVRPAGGFNLKDFPASLDSSLARFQSLDKKELKQFASEIRREMVEIAELQLQHVDASGVDMNQLDTTRVPDAYVYWAKQKPAAKEPKRKQAKHTGAKLQEKEKEKEKEEEKEDETVATAALSAPATHAKKKAGSNKKSQKATEVPREPAVSTEAAAGNQSAAAEEADEDFAEKQPALRGRSSSAAKPSKPSAKAVKGETKKRRMSEAGEEAAPAHPPAKKKDRKDVLVTTTTTPAPTLEAPLISETKRKRHAEKQARMLRELGSDVLLGGVAVFVNEKSAEFEARGFHHILDTLEEQSPEHFADWVPAEGDDMTRLERQLQDILDALMNYEVPVDSASAQGSHNPSGVKRSRKLARSPSAASHDDTTDGGESETEEDADRKRRGVRLLCELYETAPVEEIADYRSMVRRVLDLETIRDNLRQHRYCTLAAFSRDVIELLNNGRRVADKHSPAWRDGEALRALFDQLVQSIVHDGEVDAAKQTPVELVEVGTGSAGRELSCEHCTSHFVVPGWPDTEPSDTELRWRCPDCTLGKPAELVDRSVTVYWPEDDAWYRGRICDFDPSSQRHRILYDDDDWEFTFLPGQHYAFVPSSSSSSQQASEAPQQSSGTPKKEKKAKASSSGSKNKKKATDKGKSTAKNKKLLQLQADAEQWLQQGATPSASSSSTASKRKRRVADGESGEAAGASGAVVQEDIAAEEPAYPKAKDVRRSTRTAGNA